MMKNILRIILFLTSASILTACSDTVRSTDSEEYIAVNASVSEKETVISSTDVSETEPPAMTEPIEMPDEYELMPSCRLDVDVILQNPELPTGCEVTSLAILLNYCGFEIDKVELCDNYLPIEYEAKYTFNEAYIGNPKADNGFGCNAPVIVRTAESYFEAEDESWTATDLTGTDFRELFYQIEQGRPVAVWASMGLKDVKMRLRWTTEDGEEAWFAELEHCMVLTGFDLETGVVYAADPLKGDMEYSIERFESVYDQLGKQAVIIYEEGT